MKSISKNLSRCAALAVCVAAGAASAAGKPDTVAIMTKNTGFAHVSKIENLGDGSVRYRIRLCGIDGCDIALYGRDLTKLADYAYLRVAHDGGYGDIKAAADLVKDAKASKLDEAVVAAYEAQLHCGDSKDPAHCVMEGLLKSKAVVAYTTRNDEGADMFSPF